MPHWIVTAGDASVYLYVDGLLTDSAAAAHSFTGAGPLFASNATQLFVAPSFDGLVLDVRLRPAALWAYEVCVPDLGPHSKRGGGTQ